MGRGPGFRKRRRNGKWKPNGKTKGETNRLERTTARDAGRQLKEEARGFSSFEIFEEFSELASYHPCTSHPLAGLKGFQVKDPVIDALRKKAWTKANRKRCNQANDRWRNKPDKKEAYLAKARVRNAKSYKRHKAKRLTIFRAKYEAKRLALTGKTPRTHVQRCSKCHFPGHRKDTCTVSLWALK